MQRVILISGFCAFELLVRGYGSCPKHRSHLPHELARYLMERFNVPLDREAEVGTGKVREY